jgi:nudix-type nucleoside diphosphatase (YffH/AdpP family)
MTDVFLCGPWALSRSLGILGLGCGDDAILPEGRLAAHNSAVFPVLDRSSEEEIAGVLTRADGEAWDCITYLAEVLEWRIVARFIEGRKVQAILPAEGPAACAWDASDRAAERTEIAAEAIEEILEHRTRMEARDLQGRLAMVYSRAAARVAARRPAPAEVRTDTGIDTVEQLTHETPHAGFFLTQSYELRHPNFDGGMSPVVRREVFVATDAAIVLPYDPVRDRVLLVEQFRMGPYGRGDARPWMLEPVAGRVDAGEDPAQTARRECLEEAGVTLQALERISSHYCTPGCSTEYFHLYLGLCDLPETTKGRGGLDSENEDILTHILGFEAAMHLLETGEADNGPLVLSLLWLQRERARIRASA